MHENPKQVSGSSVLHPCSSNVVVHKIRSHHNESDSDEDDDGKLTVVGLETRLDLWKGIDYAEMAFMGRSGDSSAGECTKSVAQVPNTVDDQTRPRTSSVVPRIKKPKKPKKLNSQKLGSHQSMFISFFN